MNLSRESGVTLTEVLVAMVVAALLLVLFLPAVSSVKGRSLDARCMANLRAVNDAALRYINEHNGMLIPHGSWYANGSSTPPYGLREYLGYAEADYHDSVLTCPLLKAEHPRRLTNLLHCTTAVNFFLFVKDPSSTYNKDEASRPSSGGPGRLSNVPALSRMWSFTDGYINPVYPTVIFTALRPTEVRNPDFLFYHHRERQIVAFLDGHVETIPRGGFQIGEPGAYREFWGAMNLRFF